MALKNSFGKIAVYYDKFILVAVVAGLIATLGYLVFKIDADRKARETFRVKLENLVPVHPNALAEDTAPYEMTEGSIDRPFLVAAWSNAMFVPETRAWCLHCERPIPMDAEVCPFCGAEEAPGIELPPDLDTDKDGIVDVWEEKYSMDRFDPRDAVKDVDEDGFTAIEEFRAVPPTDPTDSSSTPPIEAKLRVVDIVPDPFELLFKSKVKLETGEYKFGLNMRGRTYFVKIGDTVQGFKVVKYEPNIISVEVPGSNIPRKVDASVVTLQRGDKLVRLVRGKDVQYDEYTVHLKFLIDNSTFTVRKDAEFELKVKDNSPRYRLIGIDTEGEGVVIERLHDRARINIWKVSDEVFE